MSKQCSTCIVCQFNQCTNDHGDLEPCSYKYGESGNNRLYIYTNSGAMRNYFHIKCYNRSTNNAYVQCDRSIMPKQCCTCIACQFNQCYTHYRNMESCNY